MPEGHTNRRLAAILAADVVGYSRIMEADETGTLAALKHHRENLFNPTVAAHNGRVVKLIGDGTLVEFTSVVDAVKCAVAIQLAANADASSNDITLRIGVNLGDVIIDDDDIYGDGVNVAARLEPLAEPGGICVSSIVNESVGSRVGVAFEDGGEVTVKNIGRPIRIWKWHPDDDRSDRPSPATIEPKETIEMPSIAVLPFDNMSGDPEQEYFSDGITEDLITDLSKVAGLIVIARNSTFAYKGKNPDIRTVSRDLGVRSVLEGSIRRAGNRVRITAQLIDTATGSHLWAERYDRDLTDVFEIQDEVTRRIIEALKVTLTLGEKARMTDVGTTNVEAHDLNLRARSLLQSASINRDSYSRAVKLLTRALELDPGYAEAQAALSIAYVLNYQNRWSGDADASLRRADELATEATKTDPNEPGAYHALCLAATFRGDRERAKAAVDRALALNPNDARALHQRGVIAIYGGRPEDAIPDIERALRLDPAFGQQYLHFIGLAHLMLGNLEAAATMLRERILLAPETDISRSALAATLGHLGQTDEARRVWAELKRVNPSYKIEEHLARQPFKRQSDIDTWLSGLAKAGLPG